MKISKFLFKTFLLSLIIVFSYITPINAQSVTCVWNGTNSSSGVCSLKTGTSSCASAGCTGGNCNSFSSGQACCTGTSGNPGCEGVHECDCTSSANPTSAQGNLFPALYKVIQPNGGVINFASTDPGTIVGTLLNYIFPIAGLLLLLYLIYGGYKMMVSAGDPKAAQSARSVITTAVIGFVIIFVSYWLVRIIGQVLNLWPISGNSSSVFR